MGNFAKEIEKRTERKEKNKVRREVLGKFFFDLSKLSFASLVIGWITPLNDKTEIEYNIIVMLSGIAFTFIFAIIGNKILK